MDKEDFLPIGSVVLLNGGKKELMIIGYGMSVKDKDGIKTFDYASCLTPEGVREENDLFLFNKNDISEIIDIGLIDEDWLKYKNEIKEKIGGNYGG